MNAVWKYEKQNLNFTTVYSEENWQSCYWTVTAGSYHDIHDYFSWQRLSLQCSSQSFQTVGWDRGLTQKAR